MKFAIHTGAFLKTLPLMGKGMLGIFVVTAVIVCVMLALNKFGNKEN